MTNELLKGGEMSSTSSSSSFIGFVDYSSTSVQNIPVITRVQVLPVLGSGKSGPMVIDLDFSGVGLGLAFGETEPTYSEDDVLELNPTYGQF